MGDDEHECFVCRMTYIPLYRAFCKYCFVKVPWQLRIDVMNAYRLRASWPARYRWAMRQLRVWEDGG